MSHDYKSLVYNLIQRDQQPVLLDPVLVEVFFKTVPVDYTSDAVETFSTATHVASDVYAQHLDPWSFSFVVGRPNAFHLHRCESIRFDNLPLQCLRVKLTRDVVDAVLEKPSENLDEALYNFVSHLNWDLSKVAPLLNLSFQESTRFLPQFIKTILVRFEVCPLKPNTVGRDRLPFFGPPEDEGVLPVRVVRGHLAPCTSRSVLLSLNDDFGGSTYLQHLAQRQNAIATLAYNPLENPVIV